MEVIVVGGGDSAAEEALFLTRFASMVRLVHRRDELRASKIMADRALAHPKIEAVWDTVPLEVLGNGDGVSGMRVKNVKTGAESVIPAKGVFVAIGHRPNTGAFKDALPLDENGYFLPEKGSQVRTATPGVYVAGDCADHVYRQAITAAGMGCQALQVFQDHGDLHPPVDMAGDVEVVAADHHDVVAARRRGRPVVLLQGIVQVGDEQDFDVCILWPRGRSCAELAFVECGQSRARVGSLASEAVTAILYGRLLPRALVPSGMTKRRAISSPLRD
jgi:NADPH-dependent glutamate synthase beta subunit-like oxidoreductase